VVLLGLGASAHPPVEAPEQASGAPDARTDQWLLGAMALGMLRQDEVLVGDDPPSTAGALVARIREVSPQTARVLARMVATDPAERYDDDGLVRALHGLAREAGGVSRRGEVAAAASAWRNGGVRPVSDAPPEPALGVTPSLSPALVSAPEPSTLRKGPDAPVVGVPSPEPPVARRARRFGAASAAVEPDAVPEPSNLLVAHAPAARTYGDPSVPLSAPDAPSPGVRTSTAVAVEVEADFFGEPASESAPSADAAVSGDVDDIDGAEGSEDDALDLLDDDEDASPLPPRPPRAPLPPGIPDWIPGSVLVFYAFVALLALARACA
jgi:hypothetical protein